MGLTATDYKKKDARKHRKKEEKYKSHLKSLHSSSNGYSSYPVSKTGEICPENPKDIAYYRRCYRANHCQTSCNKYFKRYSNKIIRKYQKGVSGKSGYKKLFDLWWTIY